MSVGSSIAVGSAVNSAWLSELQACLKTAETSQNQAEATTAFESLRDRVAAESASGAALLDLLWQATLSSRRSSEFWRELADVEKELARCIAAQNQQGRPQA